MNRQEWTTYNEIEFIKGALKSKHRKKVKSEKDKIKFLKDYLRSMDIRDDWRGLNKNEINLFVNRKLNNIEKGY